MENERLYTVLTAIESLLQDVDNITEEQWPTVMGFLRCRTRQLDELHLFNRRYSLEIQAQALSFTQKLVYSGPTSTEHVTEVANWCLEKWLRLALRHQNEVAVLRGIGQWWFLKAQTVLARIRHDSTSSGDSSLEEMTGRQMAARAARTYTPGQVELRGMLIPSTDYLAQAVRHAQQNSTLDGELLAQAAEAHSKLATVTHGRESQLYFQRAVAYLQAATLIPNYELPDYLQRFLDEYSKYVD